MAGRTKNILLHLFPCTLLRYPICTPGLVMLLLSKTIIVLSMKLPL